jgi:hypothetical protein
LVLGQRRHIDDVEVPAAVPNDATHGNGAPVMNDVT